MLYFLGVLSGPLTRLNVFGLSYWTEKVYCCLKEHCFTKQLQKID